MYWDVLGEITVRTLVEFMKLKSVPEFIFISKIYAMDVLKSVTKLSN